MGYQEQIHDYNRQIRKVFLQQAMFGLPVCFAAFWIFSITPEFAPAVLLFPLPWYFMALVAWVFLVLPPVISSLPTKPCVAGNPADPRNGNANNGH